MNNMITPIVTEHSAGNPLHGYMNNINENNQVGGAAPYMKMISENYVVPVGLVVNNPLFSNTSENSIFDTSHLNEHEVEFEEDEEMPDSLFNACIDKVRGRGNTKTLSHRSGTHKKYNKQSARITKRK